MAPAREPVSIRAFSRDDLPALERHMPSPHHAHRVAAHERGAATFVLAWEGGAPVGYLLVKWDGADQEVVRRHTGRCPELNGITVTAERRSRGIGTALIAAAERLVASRGIERVGLAVGVENRRARALYERLGYRAWEHGTFDASWEAPNAPGGREHETYVYLLKALSAAS